MKDKWGIVIGLLFISVFFVIMSLIFGSILYVLGVEATSFGLFILFILSFFALGSLIDLFFENLVKVLTNIIGLSSKQGFSLYLLCDLVISYKLLMFIDGIYSGVTVPKITAIVFVMILSIITCLVERPLDEWNLRETE